jgi:MraZ protein
LAPRRPTDVPLLDVQLNTPLTLDPKGRITLPSRVKGQIEHVGTNVLVVLPQKDHLRLYTKADFRSQVEQPLIGLDSFDPVVARKQRLRVGLAVEVQVDAQGRVNLPPNLRAMAGLHRDVVLMSFLGRLELWDQARFDAYIAAALADEEAGGA